MYDTVSGGQPALNAFEEFHDQWGNQGFDRWAKEMRRFASLLGWAKLLAVDDKTLYHRRALALYHTESRTRWARARREHVKDCPSLIYRCGDPHGPYSCGEEHRELDGVVLPSNHLFWDRYPLPSRWCCTCYTLGCRSDASAIRLGGDLNKTLPNWALVDDPLTGRPARTDWPFVAPHGGATAAILAAIAAGDADEF